MPLLPLILARSDEDAFIKVLFGIIVLIFWLGGAIFSAIKKRADDAKRRARYNQMPSGYTRAAPPPATNPAGFAAKTAKAKPKRVAKRQTFAAPAPAPAVTRAAAVAPASPPAPRPTRSAAAEPSQIARLLRRPESLRAALILNEVLSPPLSVRDRSDSGQRV